MTQRILIGMIDGFGPEYLEQSDMPNLKQMFEDGFSKQVSAVFPSVTNVNNVSIVCGAFPDEHGITGNSYFDEATGKPEYMNSASMIQAETIFARAKRHGVKSALLTSKRKTVELFAEDCELAIAAECPPDDFIEKYGEPAQIYSREINYWLWQVAADLLANRPDLGLIYVHTTDYPMHAWPADAPESLEHLSEIDKIIGKARDADPEAAFFFTADHGMNSKVRNWDLEKVCNEAGTPVKFVLSPERDYYVKHHNNYAGCAFVWLNENEDYNQVTETISALEGVEEIVPASEAAGRFNLVPERLGDFVVLADKDTMLGETETAFEELRSDYRNHGSLHEMEVPLAIWNYKGEMPAESEFQHNKDIARFLYQS